MIEAIVRAWPTELGSRHRETKASGEEAGHSNRFSAWMFILVCSLMTQVPALAFAAGDTSPSPLGGFPLTVIIWIICAKRVSQPIGGVLLYFYIQMYMGAVVELIMLLISTGNFNFALWDSPSRYWLFVLSQCLGPLLTLSRVAIASIMLKRRSWFWTDCLRLAFALDIGVSLLFLYVDAHHFKEAVFMDGFRLVFNLVWLIYFSRSKRVRGVFQMGQWPLSPKPAMTGAAA